LTYNFDISATHSVADVKYIPPFDSYDMSKMCFLIHGILSSSSNMSDKLNEIGLFLLMSISVAGSVAKKPKVNIRISHYCHLRLNGTVLDSTAAVFYDYTKIEYNFNFININSWI
jgi:hypothetical protein